MSELKRTQLYEIHVAAGASMVDFGGWEMPVQYPTGIVAEHLYTRHFCSLFDVSHMGRLLIEGPERLAFFLSGKYRQDSGSPGKPRFMERSFQ